MKNIRCDRCGVKLGYGRCARCFDARLGKSKSSPSISPDSSNGIALTITIGLIVLFVLQGLATYFFLVGGGP